MAFVIEGGFEMSFTPGSNDTMLSEINVTPFVDVMLVLLVIFMVTAPLVQQQVDVDLPQTNTQKAVTLSDTDVVLVITKKKELLIERTSIPIKEFGPKIKAIFEKKQKKEIFLQADQSVPYGFVVKVMALLKQSGVDKMGMITDPENRAP